MISPGTRTTGQKEGSILHQSTAARKLLWYTAPQVVVEKRCGPSISAVPHSICISLLLKRLTFGWVPCQKALSSSTCLMPLHSWLRYTLMPLHSRAASWNLSSPGTTLCSSYQRSRWCVRINSSTLLMTPHVNKYLSSRDRSSLPGDNSWAGATPSITSVLYQNCVRFNNTIQQTSSWWLFLCVTPCHS